MESRP